MLSPPIDPFRIKNPQRQPLAVAGFCVRTAPRGGEEPGSGLSVAKPCGMRPRDGAPLRHARGAPARTGVSKMADRALEKIARELSSDFLALRTDLRKLTAHYPGWKIRRSLDEIVDELVEKISNKL